MRLTGRGHHCLDDGDSRSIFRCRRTEPKFMVAIVAGNGLGLFNASNNVLGSAGILGQGWLGQSNGRSYVNAATGNLILQSQDEVLSGRGADLTDVRTYNSMGQLSDGLGTGWNFDAERKLVLTGTVNTNGSTVKRTAGDGSETTYSWNGTRYIGTDGSGAHDTLDYNGSAAADLRWTWTDGSTQLVERYGTTASTTTWRLTHQADTSGNTLSYSYDSNGRLIAITDSSQVDTNGNGTGVGSGQKILLTYGSVGNPPVTRLIKVETFELTADGTGRATTTVGAAIKQVD